MYHNVFTHLPTEEELGCVITLLLMAPKYKYWQHSCNQAELSILESALDF